MAKKTTKKVTRKVVKKTTKKAAKKVVKKVTKKVAAKKAVPAKKVVKKITNKKSSVVIKTSSLKIGDMAPEFTLEDQNGKMVSLKDFRGKNVVVYFYPKAMTPGCTVQACSLRDSQSKLNDANIVVLGISAEPVKKLKQFESKDKLNFTLLSDPEHKLIESYGSWGMKKFMGREYMGISRQSFLIDQSGKIIHIMNKVDTKTHHDDVLNFFTNLK
jgi:peroxiredoxin Q/BCP